jgi:hypothetical protein
LGQAPSISADAAALVNYSSPNTGQDGTTTGDLPPDPDLQVFRGLSEIDATVHKMIGWTTRKDYPLMVGISLRIEDLSFDRGHEAQLWEEVGTDLTISENHATVLYAWLIERFRSRSIAQALPLGMPEDISEVSVSTRKDGKAGYILFMPEDLTVPSMTEMETQILIEYDNGYMREGIGNTYTIQMVYDEFMVLTHNMWELYPALAYRGLLLGTIVHNCMTDYRANQVVRADRGQQEHPPRIIEDKGRGSEIHSKEDQGKLLQYWAWSQFPLDVGVTITVLMNSGSNYHFNRCQKTMVIRCSISG